MIVYLIKQENELQLHQLRPEQEVRFLALHGDKILLRGDSIKEVLTAFHELPLVICNSGWSLFILFAGSPGLRPAFIPKVYFQTTFQYPDVSAEADRPAAQSLEVGAKGQVHPLNMVDAIYTVTMYCLWDQALIVGQSVCSDFADTRCQQIVDQNF